MQLLIISTQFRQSDKYSDLEKKTTHSVKMAGKIDKREL